MDKSTLSQYGWVVICIIVIAILLGLATPFGNFVKESVLNTTTSFGQKITASLNSANTNGSEGAGDFDESDLGEVIQMWDISEEPGAEKVWMTYYQPDMETVPATYGLRKSAGTTDRRYENGTVYIKGEGRMQEGVYSYFYDFNAVYNDILAAMTRYVETNYPGKEFSAKLNTGSVIDLINNNEVIDEGTGLRTEPIVFTIKGAGLNGEDIQRGYSSSIWEFDPEDADSLKYIPSAIVVDEGVANISSYAFTYCSEVTDTILPSTITEIGKEAFAYSNVSEIKLFEGLEKIGEGAFAGSALTSIGPVGSGASIEIPNSVTSIGDGAFEECEELTTVVIPDTVTSLGEDAFFRCNNLTSAVIGTGITSISRYLFADCSALEKIVIPNSITSVGKEAFASCYNITSVCINDIVAWCKISFSGSGNPLSYGAKLYLNDELVTDLVIPRNVTSISSSAFEGCSSLTSVAIPNSVTSIGGMAFSNLASGSIIYCESQDVADLLQGKYYTSKTTVVVDASKF